MRKLTPTSRRVRAARGWRLGFAAVAALGEPLRAGEGGGDGHRALSAGRDPAASLLVGLSRDAARDGVLARPAIPATRAGAVPPQRRGRCLGQAAALPLVSSSNRAS